MTFEIHGLLALAFLLLAFIGGLLVGGWPAEILAERDAARTDRARLQDQAREHQAENLALGQRARRAEKAYASLYTWAYGVPPEDDHAPPSGGDTAA